MGELLDELLMCCGTVANKNKLRRGFDEMAETIRTQNKLIHKIKTENDRLRAENQALKELAQMIIDAKSADEQVRNIMYYTWVNKAEQAAKGGE